MTLKLNGIEFEFPDGTQVEVSEDGKHVKITPKEADVVETIRFVENSGPDVVERIVFRDIEVEKPCTKQHYPTWPHNGYQWTTTTSGIADNGIWSSTTSRR